MASRSSARPACSNPQTGRARLQAVRRALLVPGSLATFALSLLHCTPDFDSLRQGGSSAVGGIGSSAGTSQGGSSGGMDGLGGAHDIAGATQDIAGATQDMAGAPPEIAGSTQEIAGATQAGASVGGAAGRTQAT